MSHPNSLRIGQKLIVSFGRSTTDPFLQVLDRWTNVGVYFITHAFTLAELFALSSFYITSASIKSGFSAAEESVRMVRWFPPPLSLSSQADPTSTD